MSRTRGEGSIYRDWQRWRGTLRYRDPLTKQPRRAYFSGRTRAEVSEKLLDARSRLRDEAPVVDASDAIRHTVDAWCDVHLEGKKATTAADNRYLIRRRITPYLGDLALVDLDEATVVAWQRALIADGLAPSTVQKVRRVLAQILDYAIETGQLRRNPVRSVPAPRVETAEAHWYTRSEVERLLAAAAGDRVEPLLRFIASTGVRKGEALALRWRDVRTDGRAEINGTLARVDGKLVRQTPKTKASRRTIDLIPASEEALDAAREMQATDRHRSSGWRDLGYVFTTESGEPLDPRNVLRSFGRIKAAAGLTEGNVHSLRHGFGTYLLENGASLTSVSRHLGHSRVSVTSDIYAHVTTDDRREAILRGAGSFASGANSDNVTPLRVAQ